MIGPEIAQLRLRNQRISNPTFKRPQEVVHWLGAVQAQDYPGAKWAVAQRGRGITDGDMDRALAEGTILRTHLLRPTWHFVTPADIHWMLRLTAPRVHAANATMYRQLGLDNALFKRSNAALAKALQGGRQLTRPELGFSLKRARIEADGQRLSYLMMRAELDGVICSGARRGRQFTYALLDERAPQQNAFDREQALAELATRYFTSRGPATLKDFVWWSGLTTTEAKAGLELVSPRFAREVIVDQVYWRPIRRPQARRVSQTAHLLATYDEYLIGYKSRGLAVDPVQAKRIVRGDTFSSTILLKGRVVGTWKRTINKGTVEIQTDLFALLSPADKQAIAAAALQYGQFLELPVVLA